jgi:hypothetical protein
MKVRVTLEISATKQHIDEVGRLVRMALSKIPDTAPDDTSATQLIDVKLVQVVAV